MTPVFLLWALALAAPLRLLLLPGPTMRYRGAALTGLLILGMTPSLLLAVSGSPPELPFEPDRYALCPTDQPLLGEGTCVRDLSERHLPLLHRLDHDVRLQDGSRRKAALLGFDAAAGSASDFALHRALAPCPDRAVRVEDLGSGPENDRLAWEYFGAALAVSCGTSDARERCSKEAPPELLEVCKTGIDRVTVTTVP